MDTPYEECLAQFSAFSMGCRQDMRLLGLILMQLCFRKRLTPIELEKYRNLIHFTTADLVNVLPINRYPEPLKTLFEICFQEYYPDEMKEGRKFGSKTCQASVSYHRLIRQVYVDLKFAVQVLYHDFPKPPPQPPFWTAEDEQNRKMMEESRKELDKKHVDVAQTIARRRVKAEKRKVMDLYFTSIFFYLFVYIWL